MVMLLFLACTSSPPTRMPPPATPPLTCPSIAEGISLGVVPSPPAIEISGLAVTPTGLWMHNDAGADAQLIRTDRDGSNPVQWPLGVEARDLEDMTHDGAGTLFIGDIGDNPRARPFVRLFTLDEPEEGQAVQVDVVELNYPDGPRDAETLLYDPNDDSLLIVSKELDGRTGFYRAQRDTAGILELIYSLQMGTEPLGQTTLVTGGDLSEGGLVLRTYLQTAFVWPRAAGERVEEMLGREPCAIELAPEPQGEAIAWGEDGLYTVSEGEAPAVNFHALE